MIYGILAERETYWLADRHPVLGRVFDWLRAMPANQPLGVAELDGRRMYVNVHGYATAAREECFFESHRVYADLQYCLEGGEIIDYAWRRELGPERGAYDAGRDVLFNAPPPHYSSLRMQPGRFGIFLPTDAHRPRVHDGVNAEVRKLVVKIDMSLLS